MAVWSFNEDDSLDTSFSGDRLFQYDNAAGGSSHDHRRDKTIDAAGKLVITDPFKSSVSDDAMAVWRLTIEGALDTSFNSSSYPTRHMGSAPAFLILRGSEHNVSQYSNMFCFKFILMQASQVQVIKD